MTFLPPQDTSSVIAEEIHNFANMTAQWWDINGPMAPLHRMNPVRTEWIARHARASGTSTLLDIGCGGGIAAEAFARLGFKTYGIDANAEGIAMAKRHLMENPFPSSAAPLSYEAITAETLLERGGERFDIVTALELIEHVRTPQKFMHTLARLTKPNGLVAISTLNRTIPAYLQAILGAEYLLRILPPKTHDWERFIKPAELATLGRAAGLTPLALTGLLPKGKNWISVPEPGVNYIMLFRKKQVPVSLN